MTNKLNYPTHTLATAPENSKAALERLQKAFGVKPNIAGAIANSPKLINSLVGVFQQVHSSSFTEQEIQIVLLTDAVTNSCTYAVAFHTALATYRHSGSSTITNYAGTIANPRLDDVFQQYVWQA